VPARDGVRSANTTKKSRRLTKNIRVFNKLAIKITKKYRAPSRTNRCSVLGNTALLEIEHLKKWRTHGRSFSRISNILVRTPDCEDKDKSICYKCRDPDRG
jgi:hypothetical protein